MDFTGPLPQAILSLFEIWGPPEAICADIGSHFSGATIEKFLSQQGVLWMPTPSASKRSTGMVEKANELLERILKVPHREVWLLRVLRSAYELNRREIRLLGFTPCGIAFGYWS
ncbi:hypothetical protein OnM2_026084 [Erysiphe neolycopersici]|uniref:Integrase catalytic domain-containing protein n=1 Tax=Erysiphe neolycopersici TaxID=212602 RepID=A0A420I0U8_9PEZI|nr:hypothetical protein OnM2_026084 [Erysiphe neolycopersici]